MVQEMNILWGEGQVDELSLCSTNELFAPSPREAGKDLGVVESHFLLRPQRTWQETSVVSSQVKRYMFMCCPEILSSPTFQKVLLSSLTHSCISGMSDLVIRLLSFADFCHTDKIKNSKDILD